ncbi:MAG: hypothetical protein BECKG1743D_GA0114223_112121 [Candidatus Kentron sp. G]|nr:MAG: hypothetical protein BECKG1743F_GA0114225_109893 [Candidatus Kentron sp. G]VFN06330.1 MAG: hypothetical protein BECKG1743E_GA0114224_109992 [Candidatus Kentron sp. G]VFN07958.1 MAG: hypothetical protein BECKG1743D_GA0114223_112121 [Candidatus Kentron sp. G]
MKFRRAILHIGGDKTGSTSLQGALDRGRQMLLATGCIAYPPGWRRQVTHAKLGSYFSTEPEKYAFNKWQGLTDRALIRQSDRKYFASLCEWLRQAPACESLVFSSEGFPYLDEEALNGFKQFILQWADEVSVLVYVRPPLSYAVSGLSQRAKMGGSLFAGALRVPWKLILEKYSSVFEKEQLLIRKGCNPSSAPLTV